eukprot:14530316-Ditylum_brightwellii.AAC.1
MSFLALKTYSSITKYFLASEDLVPGHGWAYKRIDTAQSALDMARNIQSDYINGLHGRPTHTTPKTLAIVDMDMFQTFSEDWEALVQEFGDIILNSDDLNFHVELERTREACISMHSVLDVPGSVSPSAVDIGSFFASFRSTCRPPRSTDVNNLINQASFSYDSMFVARSTGPGTLPVTGVHIIWPTKMAYVTSKKLFNTHLFRRGSAAREASGKWSAFLSAFLTSTSDFIIPSSESVCDENAISEFEPQ